MAELVPAAQIEDIVGVVCAYSVALDRGIDLDQWVEDAPLLVTTKDGHLVPDPSEVTW